LEKGGKEYRREYLGRLDKKKATAMLVEYHGKLAMTVTEPDSGRVAFLEWYDTPSEAAEAFASMTRATPNTARGTRGIDTEGGDVTLLAQSNNGSLTFLHKENVLKGQAKMAVLYVQDRLEVN
jgi:hypothetical protein